MTQKQKYFKESRLERHYANYEVSYDLKLQSFLKRYDFYTKRILKKLAHIETPEFIALATEIRAIMRQGYAAHNSVFKNFFNKFKISGKTFDEMYPSSGYCLTVSYLLKISSKSPDDWEIFGLSNDMPFWNRGSHHYLYNKKYDMYLDLTGDQFNFIYTIPYSKGKRIKTSTEKIKQDIRLQDFVKYMNKESSLDKAA